MNTALILKTIVINFLLIPFGYAANMLDLTDPKNKKFADGYPYYSAIARLNFNDTGNGTSIFALRSRTNKTDGYDTIYAASINVDHENKKEVRIYYPSPDCNQEGRSYATTTSLSTNGRLIEYRKHCDGKTYFIKPESNEGKDFLTNQFKATNFVSIEFSNEIALLDTTGFTNAWNRIN